MAARLARIITTHPRRVLLVAAVVTGLMAIPLGSARVDHSLDRVVPKEHPARLYYERVRALFGLDEPVVVALRAEPSAYHPSFSAKLRAFAHRLQALEDVSAVQSLASAVTARAQGDAVVVEPALPPPDAPSAAFARAQAARDPLVSELVGADGHAVAVLLSLAPRPGGESLEEQVQRLEGEVRAAGRAVFGPDIPVHLAGLPYLRGALVRTIERELRTIAVANALVIVFFILILFRSVTAVLITLVYVSMVAVWVMGGMTLVGKDIDVYTGMVPSLILIIGVEDAIFLLTFFQAARRTAAHHRAAVGETVRQMVTVCLLTSVTTSLGFASIVTSPVPIIRGAGAVLAVGILITFVAVITVIPALLCLVPLPAARGGVRESRWLVPVFTWLSRLTTRRAPVILAGAVVLCGLIVLGISRLQVESEFIRYFKEDDPVAQANRFVDEHLGGASGFDLVIDTGAPRGVLKPARLEGLAQVVDALREHPQVGRAVALTDPLVVLKRALTGSSRPPASADEVDQLLMVLEGDAQEVLDQLAARDYQVARIRVRTPSLPSRELAALAQHAEALARQHGLPEAKATGQHLMVLGTADLIVDGQIRSLVVAALGLFVIVSLAMRSWTLGLLAMAPNLLPIFGALAVMGAVGITLNNITAINAAVGLGIAVDDTLHFLVRYRRLHGTAPLSATQITLDEVGRPILIGTLVLGSGFCTLMLSSFRNNSDTGAIGAVTLVFALIADLILLPALLVMRARWLERRRRATGG